MISKNRFCSSALLILGLCVALPAAGTAGSPNIEEAPLSALSSLYWSADFYRNLSQKIGTSVLAAGERSVTGAPGPARQASVMRAELRYQVADGIGPTLRRQLAQRMVDANPGRAASIRVALETDWLWQQFDQTLANAGYNSRNLGDVMAAYYINSWEVVHQTQARPDLYRAARNRMGWYLKRSPEIMFMTDIEKQRAAEAFGLLASTMKAGSQVLTQKGDTVGLIALQDLVYQSLLVQGVDLKRLDLARSGFVMLAVAPSAPPGTSALPEYNPCATPAPPGTPPRFGCRR